MASEILAVPEDHLAEFCGILSMGLAYWEYTDENESFLERLQTWIDDEREYMKRWDEED